MKVTLLYFFFCWLHWFPIAYYGLIALLKFIQARETGQHCVFWSLSLSRETIMFLNWVCLNLYLFRKLERMKNNGRSRYLANVLRVFQNYISFYLLRHRAHPRENTAVFCVTRDVFGGIAQHFGCSKTCPEVLSRSRARSPGVLLTNGIEVGAVSGLIEDYCWMLVI